MKPEAVRSAELLAHRTWPCREESAFGEWILRAADGYSRRANSTLAIGDPEGGVEAGLDFVEAWFRTRGVEPCVKVTPLTTEATIAALDARGWGTATPSLVMRRPAGAVANAPSDLELLWHDTVPDAWFAQLARWDAETGETARQHRALLERMPRRWCIGLEREGGVAGTLVASLEGTSAHLYDFVLAPGLRGKGLGGAFFRRALADLATRGVEDCTLQVLGSNAVARALYDACGFVEVHAYHYRVAPQPAAKCSTGC